MITIEKNEPWGRDGNDRSFKDNNECVNSEFIMTRCIYPSSLVFSAYSFAS